MDDKTREEWVMWVQQLRELNGPRSEILQIDRMLGRSDADINKEDKKYRYVDLDEVDYDAPYRFRSKRTLQTHSGMKKGTRMNTRHSHASMASPMQNEPVEKEVYHVPRTDKELYVAPHVVYDNESNIAHKDWNHVTDQDILDIEEKPWHTRTDQEVEALNREYETGNDQYQYDHQYQGVYCTVCNHKESLCICSDTCETCEEEPCTCCTTCEQAPNDCQCCEICHQDPCECVRCEACDELMEDCQCCPTCRQSNCACCRNCHYFPCQCCPTCHEVSCICCNDCHCDPCRCEEDDDDED